MGRLSRRLSPSSRLLETRLGELAQHRASVHERLDVLERYGSHLAEQGDRNTRTTSAARDDVHHELSRLGDRITGEVHHLRMELIDRIHAAVDPFVVPGPDPLDVAFASASLASLPAGTEVLLLTPTSLAEPLRQLGLSVCVLDGPGSSLGARVLAAGAASSRTWAGVVALAGDGRSLEHEPAALVASDGILVTFEHPSGAATFELLRQSADRLALRRTGP
jgi:hypothetical protein